MRYVLSLFLLLAAGAAAGLFLPEDAEVKRLVKASVKADIKGSCRWTFQDDSAASYDPSTILISYGSAPIDRAEWTQYLALNATVTRANPQIMTGMHKGKDALSKWRDARAHFAVARSHPRNAEKEKCLSLARQASERPVLAYTPTFTPWYLLRGRHALVNSLGIVAFECGYFQAHESCLNTVKSAGPSWRKACTALLPRDQWGRLFNSSLVSSLKQSKHNLSLPENRLLHRCMFESRLLSSNHPYKISDPRRVKTLLLSTAAWDYNFHHLMFESALRLYRHADFLRSNPRVMVHFQGEELLFRGKPFCSACKKMRENLLEFFNISRHRIVRGVVAADEVLIPSGVHCSQPTHHSLELRHLAKRMLGRAYGLSEDSVEHRTLLEVHNLLKGRRAGVRPVILVQDRQCFDRPPNVTAAPTPAPTRLDGSAPKSHNAPSGGGFYCDERSWNATFFSSFLSTLHSAFGDTHEIRVHNGSYLDCFACQIRQHAEADIVIGHHGAGLTNTMFMPPGAILLELAGFWDGRILPLCGHYGPYASVFNVHHYIFNFDSFDMYMLFDPRDLLDRFRDFYLHLRGAVL